MQELFLDLFPENLPSLSKHGSKTAEQHQDRKEDCNSDHFIGFDWTKNSVTAKEKDGKTSN